MIFVRDAKRGKHELAEIRSELEAGALVDMHMAVRMAGAILNSGPKAPSRPAQAVRNEVFRVMVHRLRVDGLDRGDAIAKIAECYSETTGKKISASTVERIVNSASSLATPFA